MRSTPRGASLPSPVRDRRVPGLAVVLAVLWVRSASGQTPEDLLDLDRIDISGRSSLTLGSGARAFGMGGAFLARADDATAASWNPAGLSYLRYPEFSLAGNNTLYRTERLTDEPGRVRFRGNTADFAAFTWPVRLGGSAGAVQLSFQRAVPFGGTQRVEEPREEQAPVISTGDASGGFDVIAFGTGWRFTRTLRAGITINRWFNGYEQTLERNVPDAVRSLRVFDTDFGFSGWNANLGVIWSPVEQVNLAAVFKTPFTGRAPLDKKRTDYFIDSSNVVTGTTENAFASEDVEVDFPAALGFGVSWRPRSALTLSADFTRTLWSKAEIRGYFTLPLAPLAPFFYDPLPYPLLDQEQGDSDQIRLGVEYVVFTKGLKIPLRAGYFNDQQIGLVPGTGAAPRYHGFTAGVGIIVGPMLFDVAYLYESGSFLEPVEGEAPVKNTLKTERFFLSLIYRLGGVR